jgi:hypothetical protein
MMPPSRSGVLTGRLCPCGKGRTVFCQWCHRALCDSHSAGGPFVEEGVIVLKPVCLPLCDSSWWQNVEAPT